MRTPLFFTGSNALNVSNSADRYCQISAGGTTTGGFSTLSAGAVGASRMPVAGTISQLRVRFPTPLTQGTYTITLMKGSSPTSMTATALTVTIGTSSTDAVDLVSSVTVAENECVAWRIQPAGTPTSQTASVQISSVFDATTSGRSLLFSQIAASTALSYAPIGGGAATGQTEAASTTVFPLPGTLTKMYVSLNNSAPPGAGNTRVITVRKGTAAGGLSATAMTVTFGATDTERSIDLSGSPISVAVGDFFVAESAVTGTPASSGVRIAFEFIPTTSGQAPLFGAANTGLSATATRFITPAAAGGNTDTAEASAAQIASVDMTVKSIRFDAFVAPGAAKSRAITLRRGAAGSTTLADTALTTSLSGASALTATASTDVSVTAGDTLSISHVPTSSPSAGTWTAVGLVVIAAAPSVTVNFTPGNRAGETFEGIRNTSKVVTRGTYSGTPTNVEVSLWDAPSGGTNLSGWVSATTQAAGVYSHEFSGIATGGPYYHRVRDNGGAVTSSSADLYVGAVVVMWGQSQCAKLASDDTAGLTPSAGMQVRIMVASDITDVTAASTSITRFDTGTTGLAGRTGSGVVAIANQWHIDTGGTVPLMIVMNAYSGTSIEFWNSDRRGDYVSPGSPGDDVTTLWGTSPTTGFSWFMASQASYQATAVVFMQGTSDVGDATYGTRMDTLKAKFESLYTGVATAPLFLVLPHQRSDDGTNTFGMRAIQYAKAISGGTWRVLAWLLDWQLFSDGDPHQAFGTTGNIRGGTRIGRGLAKNLVTGSLDIAGPQIVSAIFNAGRTTIDITFDRDIEMPGGGTTGVQGVFVSEDSGTTFPTAPASMPYTVSLPSARVARVTRNTGAFPTANTRIDFFRGIPFASDSGATDLVGTEANMEANFLSKVIVDTTSFNGGRGMPVAPVMGTGFMVADGNQVVPVTARINLLAAGASVAAGNALAPVTAVINLVAGFAAATVANLVTPVTALINLVTGTTAAVSIPPVTDTWPITLAEAKEFCRKDGNDEDARIIGFIAAAAARIESMTGLICRAREVTVGFSSFAPGGKSRLPLRYGPASFAPIGLISYYDTNGDLQDLPLDQVQLRLFAGVPVVIPAPGITLPATDGTDGAVQIQFNAGYANNAAVPEPIRLAAMFLVAHWFDNRAGEHETPQQVIDLLAPYRLADI